MRADQARSEPTEDTRAFLQHRVALFGLVLGILFLAGWVFRLLLTAVVAGELGALLDGNLLWHGAATVCFLAVWALLRGGPRSPRVIRIVEFAGLLSGCAAIMAMGVDIPLHAHPELIVGLCLTWALVARSVYIPSSARRTLLLALVIAVPFVGFTYWLYRGPDGAGIVESVASCFYWGCTAAICTGASGVIYGLRKEVRHVRRLGQYALEEKLGEGGMGVVYRGSHLLLRRPTAIKLVRPEATGEEQVARFEREVRLTAKLTHPNTITIYDYGRTPDGVFYYAMELLDGATLADVVAIDGAQPPERVRHVLDQVAGSLAEAHGIGLIHRDVKPTNIMLCEQGGVPDVAKVLDFGLVKDVGAATGASLTRADMITGTPQYMAPESITAPDTVDARSDLYALGAVGYFLLTGTHVFSGTTAMEICIQHVKDEPEPPSSRVGRPLPPGLEALIFACLAKDPGDRPQSARELQGLLRSCEGVGTWDGAWWWEEFGHTLRDQRRGAARSASARTLDIGLAERSPV